MSENACGKASSSSTDSDKSSSVFECLECGKVYKSQQGINYHYKSTDCSGHTCPTCGDDHFHTRFGVVRHRNRGHGESVSEVPQLSDEDWFRTKYVDEGMTTTDIAESTGASPETVREWKRKHGIESVAEYKSRGSGKGHHSWRDNTTEIECEYCGSVEEIRTRRVEVNDRNFCSSSCSNQWKSEFWVGENNPLYQGGPQDYGKGWYPMRQKALERFNYTCQGCGEHNDELDRTIEVHHIHPVRSFDNPSDAHYLLNLVPLCRPCHRKWERIGLRPVLHEQS